MFRMNEQSLERFLAKTKRNEQTGCLEWTACLDDDGYGRFKFNGRNTLAHRTGYEYFVGPIPKDKPELDHLCLNERCVEPTHLEPVTPEENKRRKALVAAAKVLQREFDLVAA